MPLIALGALLLAAGVLAAALLAGDDPKEAATTVPKTVKETVTLPGQTVVKTVTTEAPPTTAPETGCGSGRQPSDLNNQGFELMKAGNYEAALPLLEQAVTGLSGEREPRRGVRELQPRVHAARARPLRRRGGAARPLGEIQGKRKEITRHATRRRRAARDER